MSHTPWMNSRSVLLSIPLGLYAIFAWFIPVVVHGEEIRVVIRCLDGTHEERTIAIEDTDSVQTLCIPKNTLPAQVKQVEIHHPRSTARAGEEGFYVFCNGMYGTFQERPNGSYTCANSVMPFYGICTPRGAMAVILNQMRYEAQYCVTLRDGYYDVFLRYVLDGDPCYEDITVEYHSLHGDSITYSDIAKCYRNRQLAEQVVVPLKERILDRPELAYAAQSMEIRVRLGWKPVPSPVPEQTADNEPPMHVAITFDRLTQIVEEFKRQGVDRAEFCLVGWNIGGHDGRYPQIFPPDERLGGEAKLREAIQKTQAAGFQIVCHTNNSDAYHASCIGELWDEAYLLRKKDGTPNQYTTWGGGNMYETCPECMYKRFVQNDLARLKDYGFRGLHYIDVFSTVNPRKCYSPDHPLTREGYAEWTRTIFSEAQKQLGGLGSEGGFDYCVSNLDYALYTSFYVPGSPLPKLIDRHVPIWQLVYHGIVLNNPFTSTTNYTLKEPRVALKVVEYGGRPMFYYYSKFRSTGNNWMGDADLICGTDEELVQSVEQVRKGYATFEKLKYLQLEYMESHDMIAPDVFRTFFSDGSTIITNYRGTPFEYSGQLVPAIDYLLLKP